MHKSPPESKRASAEGRQGLVWCWGGRKVRPCPNKKAAPLPRQGKPGRLFLSIYREDMNCPLFRYGLADYLELVDEQCAAACPLEEVAFLAG